MILKESDFGRAWSGVWEVGDSQKSLYSGFGLSVSGHEV